MLCAKINSLENALEKEKKLRKDLKEEYSIFVPHQAYLEEEQKWRKEMSQLSLEKQLLLNEQKLTNDKNEEEMKKVLVELKNESERVRQLNIQNKMMMAENQWLKSNLKSSYEGYQEHLEKMTKELEKEKMKIQTHWKLW